MEIRYVIIFSVLILLQCLFSSPVVVNPISDTTVKFGDSVNILLFLDSIFSFNSHDEKLEITIDIFGGNSSWLFVEKNSSFKVVGSYSFSELYAIEVQNKYAFLGGINSGRLVILDVSEETKPKFVGVDSKNYDVLGLFILNDCVYTAGCYNGFNIYNVKNKTNPIFLGNSPTSQCASEVIVVDDFAYVVSSSSGLLIFNVSDKSSPDHILTITTNGHARGISYQNDCLFIADTALIIFNITDRENPREIANYDTAQGLDVFIEGDYAYLADGDGNDLKIIDISNKASPYVVGSVNLGAQVFSVHVSGDYAYCVDLVGLKVVKIVNKTNPELVDRLDIGARSENVFLDGNYIYVACVGCGLKIIKKLYHLSFSGDSAETSGEYTIEITVSDSFDSVTESFVLSVECEGEMTGEKCDIPVCDPPCDQGTCVEGIQSAHSCSCEPFWTGNTCSTPECDPICLKGICSSPNNCTCADDWEGVDCSIYVGSNVGEDVNLIPIIVGIAVPSVLIVFCLIVVMSVIGLVAIIFYRRNKKFEAIDGIDILVEESKINVFVF